MEHQLTLARAGIELLPTPVTLHGDGLTVPPGILTGDRDVQVITLVNLRGMDHLLVARGMVVNGPTGPTVEFIDMEPGARDTLVAFCFQQQGEERRRAIRLVGG